MAFVDSNPVFNSPAPGFPTPPRDTILPDELDRDLDDINEYLEDCNEVDKLMSRKFKSLLSTPQQTPPSSAPTTGASSRDSKRVDFASFMFNTYHPHSDSSKENIQSPGLQPLPPSRERSALKSRSILKTPKPLSERTSHSAHNFTSLVEMLEWALKSLAKDVTAQRIDAYVSLLGMLQAYGTLPDPKELKDRFKLLLHFIRRDMASVDPTTKVANILLITKSMNLLMCLLRLPELKDSFDSEECASIMDFSITVLQETSLSKTIANYHLEYLSIQKFGPRVLTSERAQRLLDALRTLEKRIDGGNVIGRRLAIYSRLVEQIPAFMASGVLEWLDHVFQAMLSDKKEIRQHAMTLGISSGLKLGTRKEASKALKELLQRKLGEVTYCQFLMDRLAKDLAVDEYKTNAAVIWSVPVLYLQAIHPSSLDKSVICSLLSLPQRCINTGDARVKSSAFRAWSRLIFAENLSLSTPPKFRKLLKAPIETQLLRQKDGKYDQSIGQIALSTYCTLLYYALRPGSPFEQLDLYWDEYVVQILSTLCPRSRNHALLGCHILTSLFSSEALWNENRCNEEPWNLEIAELPRLDPAWIRSRLSRILDLVKLFCDGFVDTRATPSLVPGQGAIIYTDYVDSSAQLWSTLLTAVADAGSKEVTPSMELKTAVANVTNLISRVWSTYSRSKLPAKHIITTFEQIVGTLIEKLGLAMFAEKILSRNSSNSFEAVPTPSHRSRAGGPLQSPALHLIGLLSATYQDDSAAFQALTKKDGSTGPSSHADILPGNKALLGLIESITKRCLDSRTSRNAKLAMLADIADTIIHSAVSDPTERSRRQRDVGIQLSSIVHLASSCMSNNNTKGGQSAQIGQDYKLALRILGAVIHQTTNLFPAIEELYRTCVTTVRQEAGDCGILLAMTEPHAEMICAALKDPSLAKDDLIRYAAMILREDVRPRNRRAIEQSRKSLWCGISSPVTKSAELEYTHLYPMINQALKAAFERLSVKGANAEIVGELVVAITGYLERASAVQAVIVRNIQDGVSILLRDQMRKLMIAPVSTALFGKIQQLWKVILVAISSYTRKDDAYLQAFDTLISAGLSCRRIAIVNSTVAFWNENFGAEIELKYPPQVAKALRKLKPVVELELPGTLPESGEVPDSPLSIEDASEEPSIESVLPESPHDLISPKRQLPILRLSKSPVPNTISPARAGRSSPFRRATTPRRKLRHEDSQIQFEAIQSSPVAEQESQLLTDRQKEVAERQRLHTAPLFADVSSPARKHAVDFSSDPLDTDFRKGRQSTPILQVALDDDLPISSPIQATVSRRRERSRSASRSVSKQLSRAHIPDGAWQDEEIPSSPPRVDDDDGDTSRIAEPEKLGSEQAHISPLRLQSKFPTDPSHDELVERARKMFASMQNDTPTIMISDADANDKGNTLYETALEELADKQYPTRDSEDAHMDYETQVIAGTDDAPVLVEAEESSTRVEPSIPVSTTKSGNDHELERNDDDVVQDEESALGTSTTNPISSETFIVHATAALNQSNPIEATTSSAKISTDECIPDSQFAQRPQLVSSGSINACRVGSSSFAAFHVPVTQDGDLVDEDLREVVSRDGARGLGGCREIVSGDGGLGEEVAQGDVLRIEASRVEASQGEASQVEASQVEAPQVGASQVVPSQVEASQVEESQVEESEVEAPQVDETVQVEPLKVALQDPTSAKEILVKEVYHVEAPQAESSQANDEEDQVQSQTDSQDQPVQRSSSLISTHPLDESQPAAKRKRGRPRRVENPENLEIKSVYNSIPADSSDSPGLSQSSSGQSQTTVKRKRGRPPLLEQADRVVIEALQTSTSQDSTNSQSQSQDSVKRRRGRSSSFNQSRLTETRSPVSHVKQLTGFNNGAARRPTHDATIFSSQNYDGDLIVVKAMGTKQKTSAQCRRSDQNAITSSPLATQASALSSPSQKPSTGEVSPSQYIPQRRDFQVPELGRRLSSRLSEMGRSSPKVEPRSPATPALQQSSIQHLRSSQILNSRRSGSQPCQPSYLRRRTSQPSSPLQPARTPVLERRSSRLSQTANDSPQYGVHDLDRMHRRKRTLSQSQKTESQAADEELVAVHAPDSESKRRRLSESRGTTHTTTSGAQVVDGNAYVAITPGNTTSSLSNEQAGTSSTQKVEAALCDETRDDEEQESTADSQTANPSQDSSAEVSQARSGEGDGRRILTPKSILARLMGILTDCKTMVFGSQERREIDDVLFEVKSEVFRR